MELKHTSNELKIMQAYPLEMKVELSKKRIREWVEYWGQDNVAVSFSGGKDSTVLLHLVRSEYPNIKAYFVDTGLEYPEIKEFVRTFNNCEILRPDKCFREVIEQYGYPIISKEASERVGNARKWLASNGKKYTKHATEIGVCPPARAQQILGIGEGHEKKYKGGMYDFTRWKALVDLPFNVSNQCCNVMKKKPMHHISEKCFVGTLADESLLRKTSWMRFGCNGFNMAKNETSRPLSFWTEQDILHYIKQNDLPIASVYGNVEEETELLGQQSILFDCDLGGTCKLCTTGAKRTGCMYCLYGMHLEKGETRLQLLHKTHPKIYEYIMGGGAFDKDGLWKPTANGLGFKFVCDKVNEIMGKELYRY